MYILYLVSGMVILPMRSDQISPQSETYDWSLVVDYKRHILIIDLWCKCPAEWGKNVRENLFVLYAVMNYIRRRGTMWYGGLWHNQVTWLSLKEREHEWTVGRWLQEWQTPYNSFSKSKCMYCTKPYMRDKQTER